MPLFLELYGSFVLSLHIIASVVLLTILLVLGFYFRQCIKINGKNAKLKRYFKLYKWFFIANGILLFLIGLSGILLFVGFGFNEYYNAFASSKIYIYAALFTNIIIIAVMIKKIRFVLRYAYLRVALRWLRKLSIYSLASQMSLSLLSVTLGLLL